MTPATSLWIMGHEYLHRLKKGLVQKQNNCSLMSNIERFTLKSYHGQPRKINRYATKRWWGGGGPKISLFARRLLFPVHGLDPMSLCSLTCAEKCAAKSVIRESSLFSSKVSFNDRHPSRRTNNKHTVSQII